MKALSDSFFKVFAIFLIDVHPFDRHDHGRLFALKIKKLSNLELNNFSLGEQEAQYFNEAVSNPLHLFQNTTTSGCSYFSNLIAKY